MKHNQDSFGLMDDTDAPPARTHSNALLFILFIIAMCIGCVLAAVAGYHSWMEFPNDVLSNKMFKTTLAMLFSPVYLSYIGIKTLF